MACPPGTGDCAPCKDCDDPTPPILPRCNDPLPADGSFENATVVVVDGCIVDVRAGVPPTVADAGCCDGGEPGVDGLDGAQGPAGPGATIEIGVVTTLPAGTNATVENVGTPTAAVLNIGIPRGDDGTDGQLPSGGVNYDDCGLKIVNGQIQQVPSSWPPVTEITTTRSPSDVAFTAVKTCTSVALTLDLTTFRNNILTDAAIGGGGSVAISDLQARVSSLETQVATMNSTLAAQSSQISSLLTRMQQAESKIADIQTNCCPP